MAQRLRNSLVDVLVIDRHNHHTFMPLLYEVATAGLAADDIAQPVRAILRGARNVRFLLAEVTGVDLDARRVITDACGVPYDYLVISAGTVTNYFGMASVERNTIGLKDLSQANAMRSRILRNFERATVERDATARARLMTMVVVGGGPTGVELAGALAELKRHVLRRDYPDLDLAGARVILIEATGRLLPAMPACLQRKALDQLRGLGVDVRLGALVTDISEDAVTLRGGETIGSSNVVWVAGTRGAPLAAAMGFEVTPDGRIPVGSTLQLDSRSDVYAIGDIALLEGPDSRPYPMLAQVALQQGDLAARNILRAVRGELPLRFRYRDRGTMATIGRRMAVAHVFGLQFSGSFAWALWLVVHLLAIIGLRNRALVLLNWTWNYVRYDRASRLVTDDVSRGEE
ncbi:MAG: NAD(P)/FAD-dependent oxidoreductase [Chloroflexota bacterium]|nr:NAD(P)/FAD-dependent oxidoreductase [Chloroflexota bacterium]